MSSFLAEQILAAQLTAIFVVLTAAGQYLCWCNIACDMGELSSNHGSAKKGCTRVENQPQNQSYAYLTFCEA